MVAMDETEGVAMDETEGRGGGGGGGQQLHQALAKTRD